MIIGSGDLASALREANNVVGFNFFAAGVSNSQEERESEYSRELDLLLSQDPTQHIVYFSSLAVFYKRTRYAIHKMHMEHIVRNNFPSHTIVRLGNITWGNNPHTIINHFKKVIADTGGYVLSKDSSEEYRYIVDKDEFIHWIQLIPRWNCEMNITGRMMTVLDMVEQYCK